MTLATVDKSWQVKCHSVDKGRRGGVWRPWGIAENRKVIAKREEKQMVETGGRKCRKVLNVHPRLIANFLVHAEKVAI
jgi:hypothetical protein